MKRSSRCERAIRQRLEAFADELPAARTGDRRGLHRARVAVRRLRESVAILPAGHPAKLRKAERALRRLRRALGPVRELDVALRLLDGFHHDGLIGDEGARRLQSALADQRRRLHELAVRRIDSTDLDRLTHQFVPLARHDEPSKKDADATALLRARHRVALRGRRLKHAIAAAAGLYLPDRLHTVRIAVKKLRYAMEIERELKQSRAVAPLRRLKESQDLLGQIHDLEGLITRGRAIQVDVGDDEGGVSSEIDAFMRHLEGECRRLHAQYLAAAPKLAAIGDDAIAPAGPRVRSRPAA